MALIEKRTHGGTVTWVARWRDPAGRQRKRSHPRKSDAERFLATVEADKARGVYIDHSTRVTVTEYARAWAETRPHRSFTAARVSSLSEVHIAGTSLGGRRQAAGGRRLVDVRPSEVQAWATDRASVLAPSTVRALVALLRSIYAAATLDRLVASSPAVKVTLPRHERQRVVPLSVGQVQPLADAMPPAHRAMVLVQASLGLRLGELLALRVQDLDFLSRTVRVESQLEGATRRRIPPKTPRSRRTVPLPVVAAEALAAHIAACPPLEDGSVFSNRARAPWHANHYSRVFARGVQSAGLPTGTTTHDLRHLRLGSAGRRGVGCDGRRAPRARERDAGADHLRAPHAGL